MSQERAAVEAHYQGSGIGERILEAMRAAGVDPHRDGVESAPPLDHLHVRGRDSTEEILELAAPKADERVLDAGSGLGGPARLVAARAGCRVLGVDLTGAYCRAARTLSTAFGLGSRTVFVQGSATRAPVRDGAFSLVWTQHAQMNIGDKEAFYGELVRALAPGGRLVFHDIFAGPAGAPAYPVPWAQDAGASSLAPPEAVAAILEGLGLRRAGWWDRTAESAAWAREAADEAAGEGAPRLLLGDTALAKLTNLRDGLENDRLRVIVARWERP